MKHELKIYPVYFEDVVTMVKPFEVRKFDRPYAVGDTLNLKEFDPDTCEFTGRNCDKYISYLLDSPQFCKRGYVILGLR